MKKFDRQLVEISACAQCTNFDFDCWSCKKLNVDVGNTNAYHEIFADCPLDNVAPTMPNISSTMNDYATILEFFSDVLCDTIETLDGRFMWEEEGGGILELISEAQNVACHCHPQYKRECYELPMAIAQTFDKEKIKQYFLDKKEKEAEAEKVLFEQLKKE